MRPSWKEKNFLQSHHFFFFDINHTLILSISILFPLKFFFKIITPFEFGDIFFPWRDNMNQEFGDFFHEETMLIKQAN